MWLNSAVTLPPNSQPAPRIDGTEEVLVRRIENSEVRARQIAGLKKVRTDRDQSRVTAALDALSEAASGSANLMPAAIEAARAPRRFPPRPPAQAYAGGSRQAPLGGACAWQSRVIVASTNCGAE